MLREIKRKIRENAKDFWESNAEYENNDPGLNFDEKFHHYTHFDHKASW